MNFKVGDKVKQIGHDESSYHGEIGTVINIVKDDPFPVIVRFFDGKEIDYKKTGAGFNNRYTNCKITHITPLEELI